MRLKISVTLTDLASHYRLARNLGRPGIDQRNNVFHRAEPVSDPAGHRWRYPERLVDADEIVPKRIEHDHVRVIGQLLRERVCQPGEPPHRHAHREVRPFRATGADIARVELPVIFVLAGANTIGRAAAPRRFGRR
jgi:hypothetical protein